MARFKVFVTESESNGLPEEIKIEERYPAFVIASGSEVAMKGLQSKYPVEELKSIGALAAPQSSGPRRAVRGKAAPTSSGDVIIRFHSPIREEWLKDLELAGAQIKRPLGDSSVFASVPNAKVWAAVKGHAAVLSIDTHVPDIRLSAEFVTQLKGGADDKSVARAAKRLANGVVPPKKERYSSMPGIVVAYFMTAEDCSKAEKSLLKKGVKEIHAAGSGSLLVNLHSAHNASEALAALSGMPGLRGVEEKSVPKLQNNVARLVIGQGVVTNNPGGLGLGADGEIVAVADTGLDTGDPNTIHADFRNRIKDITSFPISPSYNQAVTNPGGDDGPADLYSGHGTHTTGSVLGDGSRAVTLGLAPIQGLAPKAKLVFQAIEQTPKWTTDMQQYFLQNGEKPPVSGLYGIPDNLLDLFDAAYGKGARIHSNSWGGGKAGDYDNQSGAVDRFVWEHRDFLIVIAAGNDGKEVVGGNTIELGSVTPPGTAKNCLTVGASENNRAADFTATYGQWWPGDFPNPKISTDSMTDSIDDLVAFSSRGPCNTTRRKPDVVAPGTFVLSTRSSQIASNNFGWSAFAPAKNDYMFDGGTSMATPLAAGAAALVRQYLRTIVNLPKPSAALLKASLIHSAQYLNYRYANPASSPWADNEQGWGRIDLASVLEPTAPTNVLFFDEDHQLHNSGDFQEISINVGAASVPLRMTMVFTDFPGESLVNNLNLMAYAPGGQYSLGNDFQSSGTPDRINNVEGIVISSPSTGIWRIRVVASEIQQGPQPFALVVSGANISLPAPTTAPASTSAVKARNVRPAARQTKGQAVAKKVIAKKAHTKKPSAKRKRS